MSNFKIPVCQPMRKRIKGQEDTVSSRLESSASSCCPQQTYSAHDYITNLYKSISLNASKNLQNSSELSSCIKTFGETVLRDELNSTAEWQLHSFVERHRKRVAKTNLPKSIIQKRVNFERWWCVLTDDRNLCIQGFVENKTGMVQTEPVIKRMDSRTVATRNSLCKLKTFGGGDYGLPSYIKERFAFGFPSDWVQLKKKWILFLQAGKPQDFQWKENRLDVSADDVYLVQKPSEQSSLENSCEEFTGNIHERNFAFSPLVGKSKVTGRAVGHTSNADAVRNHGSENRENLPDLQGRRDIYVIPECSDTDKTTKKYLLATKQSFTIATDDSGNSTDADIDIESRQTSCLVVKRNRDQYENMQQLPVRLKKNNTSQASQVLGPPTVPANVKPESPPSASVSSLQASPPVAASIPEKRGQPSKVLTPRVVLVRVDLEPPSVASASSRQASPLVNVTASVPEKQRQFPNGTEILLNNWLPILVKRQLCFKGTRETGRTETEYTTSAVKSRVDKDAVKLLDGTTCRLVGSLTDKDNCLPASIGSEFRSGIPKMWRKLLLDWIDYTNIEAESAGTIDEKSPRRGGEILHVNNQKPENLKTSRRGRILVKPVNYWLGETYTSVISKVVSEKKRSNTPGGGPQNSPAMAASDESEKSNKPKIRSTKNVKNYDNAKRKKKSLDLIAKKSHKEQEPSVSDKVVSNTENKKESLEKTAKKSHENQEPSVSDKVVNNTKQKKESLERTAKKSREKQDTSVPMKKRDMNLDFTDFVGRPRTVKQRKKLDNIVKTQWPKDKKNTDIFGDDSTDSVINSNVAWDEFIPLKTAQRFNIGELTPNSRMLNGTYLTTPVTSPSSTSLFQFTPCKSDEVLRYVHQQKTKDDKRNKKKNTRQKKTPFLASLVGNQAADDVYAALLNGDPISNIMNKEMSDDSSLTQLSD